MTARILSCLFFILAFTAGPVAVMVSSPGRDGQPVLVVTAPWGPTPEQVIHKAGGDIIGPETAFLGLFAASSDPSFRKNLKTAGALAVLDARLLANICGVEA